MAVACDSASLLAAISCYRCIPNGLKGDAMIYLLQQIAGTNYTADELMELAKCNRCIPRGFQNEVIVALLCQIANS